MKKVIAHLFVLLTLAAAPLRAEFVDLDLVKEACENATDYLVSLQWDSGCIQDAMGRLPDSRYDYGSAPRNGLAMTSLAIMAFAATGHLPGDPTEEGEAMKKALEFVLLDRFQDDLGYFGNADKSRMYGHGIITLMLAELLGMGVDDTMDRRIRDKCQAAIDLILRAQVVNKREKDMGGWRYAPNSTDSDLSVTVWQVMALRAAKNAGLKVPRESIDDAIAYVRRCFIDKHGAFSYEADRENRVLFSTAAAGMLSMQVCGRYDAAEVRRTADFLLKREAKPDSQWFFYGMYYYAQGMAQRGGDHEYVAKEQSAELLLALQNANGSWHGRHGQEREAGKVYATTMAVLSLSVHFNYLPIYRR
ncbi:MAG: prenyltransferase/squalene oxidase repeat-containing protein [Verrucomicrobiota bacterium]